MGGGGGGGLKVISPLDGGGQEVILTLIQGWRNFILRPTLLILEPPPSDNYCTILKRLMGMCRWMGSHFHD